MVKFENSDIIYVPVIFHIPSNHFREINSIVFSSSKGTLNFSCEIRSTISHLFGCFVVQWISRIRLNEQENESQDNSVNSQYWFPIGSENIKANVSLEVNIWMVDWSYAMAFRSLMRIIWGNFNSE